MNSTSSLDSFLSFAAIVILLRSFPFVFDVLGNISAVFALISIFYTLKSILRKHFLNGKISSKNKAVLITGCDSGFGFLLAQRLDQLGFHVFAACLFPSGEGAQELKSTTSPKLQILGLDVTNNNDVLNALEFVKAHLKDNEKLWAVVNNAGIEQVGEIEWAPVEEIRKTIDVNTMGTVRVTKALLPLLRKSKGRVVNTASLAGRLPTAVNVGYGMSKRAVISFTSGLRMEMDKFGVKVISVEPHFYKTPITDSKRLLKTLDKVFDESPQDVQDAYGKEYLNDLKQLVGNLTERGSTNVNQVIDCFEDAITAEEPQPDYFPCYLPHKLVFQLLRLLPQQLVEKLLKLLLPRFNNPAAL